MFTCYFDEAGGKDHGFTVVAGYIASVEQWEHFEVDWKLFLISYKVPYFHMSRLSQFKSPFAKWKDTPNFRARFLQEAAHIIKSRVIRGFSCFVRHECFDKADSEYELRETIGSPYALAGMLCVANAIKWKRKNVPPATADLEYVFEDGESDKCGLMKIMAKENLSDPIFKPSRDISHRKSGIRRGVVQLQAADYLAYEIRKYVKDYIQSESEKRIPRASLAALTGVEVDKFFLAHDRIVAICKRLKLKRA